MQALTTVDSFDERENVSNCPRDRALAGHIIPDGNCAFSLALRQNRSHLSGIDRPAVNSSV